MTTLLSASGLKKTFGDKPLFSNLSFVCEEGERVAILGPNGAGKSTFLSMLSGKSEPDEGSISRKRGLTAY
jgi:ATPase subunit of ABC transporter with duplicated ATPase domains